MTDNTKAVTLKLQAAKSHEPVPQPVFLGNFVYAEFMTRKLGGRPDPIVRLTDTDGCGRALDVISLDSEQFSKLLVEWRKTEKLQAGCVNT